MSYAPPSMPGTAPQAGLTTKPGGHAAPARPSAQQFAGGPPSGQHDSLSPTSHRGAPLSQPPLSQPPLGHSPASQPPLSRPPLSSAQRAPTAAQVSNPSMSFGAAPVSRPMGLIVMLLLIDLGLAGAGVFLLAKGLEKPKAAPAEKPEQKPDQKTEQKAEQKPEQKTGAAPPAPVEAAPAQMAAAAPQAAATPPSAADTAPTRADTPATARASAVPPSTVTATPITPFATAKKAGGTGSPVAPTEPAAPAPPETAATTTATTAPQVPAPAASPMTTPQQEINAAYTRSQPAFDRCRGNIAVAGRISVAFHVQPDGTLGHVAAVENTTGNDSLAQCLVAVITPWRVTPFQGSTFPLVRQFNYQ